MLYRPDTPIKTPGPCREASKAAALFAEIRRCFLEECCDVRALPALAIWGGLTIVSLLALLRQVLGIAPIRLEIRQALGVAVVAVLLAVVAKRLLRLTGNVHPSLTIRILAAVCGTLPVWALAGMSLGRLPANVTICIVGMAVATGWLLLLPATDSPLSPTHQSRGQLPRTIPLGLFRLETSHTTHAGPYLPPSRKAAQPLSAPESQTGDKLPSAPDKNAWQWMSRTQQAGGGESIQGITRAQFGVGEKQAVVHLAFNPPFVGVPEFTCELADDSVARIKLTAAYPYGLRIELKRSVCETAAAVEIRYSASTQSIAKAA